LLGGSPVEKFAQAAKILNYSSTKDSAVVIFEKFLNFVPFVVQCVYFSL